MNTLIHKERLRITSIHFKTSKWIIFSGVPLAKNSYKVNSGKYYVSIKINPVDLPIEPSIGQHWLVSGTRNIAEIETGDYLMEQHTYESPHLIECQLPETGEQFIQFIAREKQFKGIGESKARALWDNFGNELFSILRRESLPNRKRLAPILSEDSIKAIFEGYQKYKNLEHCNWMSKQKIPANIQQRLLKHHGENSIKSIKLNPYLLVGFGMSFTDIDKLAISGLFNISNNDHRRLSAALETALRKEIEKGHTYTEQAILKPYLTKLLKDKALVSEAFKAGHDKAQYILNPNTGTYHPTAQLIMENVVVKRLIKLASQKNLYDKLVDTAYQVALQELPYKLTNKQTEAVTTCLSNTFRSYQLKKKNQVI